ncbi:MAG: pyridine nucleotide-disulfide oxidoreductase [Alphaproteobacteria bacterium]|nr:pyridine nucleotide-disulfide oxidoreductase [Alphaproteobacteria bacterium]PHY01032.1 MAG: pyridine nucleotide-disulfide oxidoreductase [Rhodospirillaceae bacterium]
MSEHKVVIIGAGEAGGQTAISLRQGSYEGRIIVLGDEAYIPYERPPLSKAFLAGEAELERMYMRGPEFYPQNKIELRLNTSVKTIDRTKKRVTLINGEALAYDKLVIATGGRVRKLSCPGAELPGVHYLRSIDDVIGYRDQLVAGANLAIIGGGYIGLEVAAVVIKRGCKVTVIEALPRVLNRVVAPEMSAFYTDVHRQAGVNILTSTAVTALEGQGKIEYVVCNTGQRIAADLAIVGIGIVPNIAIAQAAGLNCDNGIVVDKFALTSDPDIYAVGDCSNHPNEILGRRLRLESVPNALAQGKAAALHILGKPEKYAEVPWFWSDQYDLKLQMTGLSEPGDTVVIRGSMPERKFSACYLRHGVFVACNAVNMAKDFLQSKKLIAAKNQIDPVKLADVSIPLKDMAV